MRVGVRRTIDAGYIWLKRSDLTSQVYSGVRTHPYTLSSENEGSSVERTAYGQVLSGSVFSECRGNTVGALGSVHLAPEERILLAWFG